MKLTDISKLIFQSQFSGLGNYLTATGTLSYAGGTVASNTLLTFNVPITNLNSVSNTEIQFSGLDSTWYTFKGTVQLNYNNSNVLVNNISNATKQITVYGQYTSTAYVVNVWLSNISLNPSVTFPAMTITCNASIFIAPF